MIGSKLRAEAADASYDVVVEERSVRVEAIPEGVVDFTGVRMRT